MSGKHGLVAWMRDKFTSDIPLIVRLRALAYAATITRFNLFILVAGFVLLFVPQGQDLLIETNEQTIGPLFLLGGGLLWALSIWYWARVLLDIRFPYPPIEEHQFSWWRSYLPRFLGLLAFFGLGWNLYRATGWTWQVTAVLVLAIIFYLFVLYRRPMGRWWATRRQPNNPRGHWAWLDPITAEEGGQERRPQRWQDDFADVWKKPPVKLIVLLGVLMFVWGIAHPLSMGQFFNTLVLLFLWGATFLPGGSVITYIGSRKGIPLFAILIALAMLFSYFNDNHTIRAFEGNTAKTRPSIEAGLAQWAEKHKCTETSCPPFIVMATAGGGIRAAYWTATVLGHLDDELAAKNKPLRDHLFAISGVSGGSVGATVYRASLEAGVPAGRRMETVQAALAEDYLGPLAAGLLYKDLLQRFLPVGLLEDRASVFEKGLETGFADTVKQDTLKTSFSALTADSKHPWPALFLNSTWSDNGRRIVAAGYTMADNEVLYADLIDRLGYDMRLSTAAHNSARFPYASPPGSWKMTLEDEQREAPRNPPGEDRKPTKLLQRLQDGGLFENYGAETALEILHAARRYFHDKDLHFDPLVILVSSDPDLAADIAKPRIREPINFGYEVLTTLRTYAATRVGRGAEAASRLKSWVRNPDTRFAYFRMCRNKKEEKAQQKEEKPRDPPLGWALSEDAQDTIESYLLPSDDNPACFADNQAARDKVVQALAPRDEQQ